VPIVRGLIAGRSILAGAAQAWLAGEKSDEATTLEIAARFRALIEAWSERSAN
jgi:myo-inositol catabolism protein IolC